MIINEDGSIGNATEVVTDKKNILLGEDQFLQWTPSGKTLELWEGKESYLTEGASLCRRVTTWNEKSVIMII